MSDVIRLLPDSVANQIAAGEVIQRPASVIKELVENAVDAGATDIQIVIKDAGKTLIQVVDNGVGMSETDVRMAFERHATSKIQNADDLFTLHTMGFRGEALPSICAISEVEVRTRKADSAMGTRLLILGSKVIEQEPVVCDTGTVISVRKIFFNVPARRKFLKSDSVELSNIMREFERLALVNNNVRMRIDNGVRNIDLRPASLRLRIEDIWKNNLKSDHLIPVDVDTSLVKIEGFVSRPEYARRRNPLQFLIVNGRNMRHPYFHKAILSCFDGLIASDTQPNYFMRFNVDPSTIDVNIHPTKNEIKFEYEQQIWPILVSAVKTALGKYSAVPSIDFSVDAIPLDPVRDGENPIAPNVSYRGDYNPFKSERPSSSRVNSNWDKLYEAFFHKSDIRADVDFIHNDDDRQRNFSNDSNIEQAENGPLPHIFEDQSQSDITSVCMQFAGKYIVTGSRDGLLIIDQHRAHVKILFEEYLGRFERTDFISQPLMFPELISLDSMQQAALKEVESELGRIGFSIEYDSENTWRISSIPAIIKQSEARDVVLRILDSVTVDSENYGKENDISASLSRRIALVLARSAAIRRGQKLSPTEMESLISALFVLPDPAFTPNGNLVYTVLNEDKIIHMFT
ncbi:MAG: DNA mismatch repair endonuclease MutL [Bacteroidales bacterium]|nr:DNA mismatch repair endonuclease MutL [Bacteroidales bacterium]MBD5222646.1 DNA mismatch repair endonuclease MutL [Bacteroidales bacterium]